LQTATINGLQNFFILIFRHCIPFLGDEIKLTCWFTSAGAEKQQNHTIYWGEGTELS